jgi:hypothetical protein
VAGEERLAVLLEILLVRIKHAIQPRQKLLGTVVGVQDNRDTVGGSDCADVVGTSNCTGNRSLLVLIVDTLLTRQESILTTRDTLCTFPAKYAAPPWDIWRIIGAPASRAASRVATTVEEEVTF